MLLLTELLKAKRQVNALTSGNLSCPCDISIRVKLILMKEIKQSSLLNILYNEKTTKEEVQFNMVANRNHFCTEN